MTDEHNLDAHRIAAYGCVGANVLDAPAGGNTYPLSGLLHCRSCEQLLNPATALAGTRIYECPNGCRSTPIDAAVVERVVLDAAERADPALIRDAPADSGTELFASLVASVVVDADVTDLRIFWIT
jgi:hypothetical protein